MKTKYILIILYSIFCLIDFYAQESLIYKNLPVGKYAVGFKIITITDDSRVTAPAYNYLGEQNEGDRSRKITLHLWYPAEVNTGKQSITYGDYCYNYLLTSTNEIITPEIKNREWRNRRNSVENWFGKTSDEAWKQLLEIPMLAQIEAPPVKAKFPLLIGTLRSLSTSITNEMLASNGYVVAMVSNAPFSSFADAALELIPDMQFAIHYLINKESADASKIGTFGFSGSGFIPVLFGMYDYRIKALADIESGIYMEGLYQGLSASNYYKPSKLQIPFLHIFSRDLSKQEKYLDELEQKAKFSKRYRLLLNQPALHHWDFASEGYTSCTVLKMRGAEQNNIKQSFEIASIYLLNFFNAELKADPQAKIFLSAKPSISQTPATLWDMTTLPAIKPAPDQEAFEYIIKEKGIEVALETVRNTIQNDSSTNLLQGFTLNNLGYTYLSEKKYKEAIGVFQLNAEWHPDNANWIDSLAEAYETMGDKENTRKIAQQVLAILDKKATLTDAEKALKAQNEKRSKLP